MGGNGKLNAKIRVWRLDPERDGALARAGATRTAFSVYRGDGDVDEHIARLTTRTQITERWVGHVQIIMRRIGRVLAGRRWVT